MSAGSLKVAFGKTPSAYFKPVDAGTANYREIYWRWYVRYEPTWQGGAGYKMTRATSFASAGLAQSMIAHVWGGSESDGTRSRHVVIDPASGTDTAGTLITTKYNDFANLRWLGAVLGKTAAFDASHVGAWYCMEARVRLNDAGASNGVFELWLNGAPEAQRTGFDFVGAYSTYGINAVILENYWNTGSPKRQERLLRQLGGRDAADRVLIRLSCEVRAGPDDRESSGPARTFVAARRGCCVSASGRARARCCRTRRPG